MRNIDRVIASVAWILLSPFAVLMAWTLLVEALPVPSPLWGALGMVAAMTAVSAVPFGLLRSARKADHAAGTILASIALCVSLLGSVGISMFSAVYTGPAMEAQEQVQAVSVQDAGPME